MSNPRRVARQPLRQVASFAMIGAISTLAYVALYVTLRTAVAPLVANGIALVVTALGNTAANRRWTFDVRGSDGIAQDHAAGLTAFLVALAITSLSIGILQAVVPHAGRILELTVVIVANGLATVTRFLLLRTWFTSGRLVPRLARDAGRGAR